MMANDGHSDLTTLDGGFHGAYDRGGNLAQPGWSSMGFESSTSPNPERTWESLDPNSTD